MTRCDVSGLYAVSCSPCVVLFLVFTGLFVVVLKVQLDKRINIGTVKRLLLNRLDVPLNYFKLYRVFSNNQVGQLLLGSINTVPSVLREYLDMIVMTLRMC